MNNKKFQEVKHMASAISTVCQKYNCGTVIDIGSGLGYLDQVLHHNFGLTVVGLDCEVRRSQAAECRVEKGLCKGNMYHFTYNVDSTPESVQYIREILNKVQHTRSRCSCGTPMEGTETENIKHGNDVIMIGLHSCGSLVPDMMKLFVQLPEVKLFFCVGCCYHRMNMKDFPLSIAGNASIEAAKVKCPSWSPSVYGFRLGSQDARAQWASMSIEDHELHTKHVAFRGILEYFLQLEGLSWSRAERRFFKLSLSSSFEKYALAALKNIAGDGSVKEEKLEKLCQIFQEQQHLFACIRILALFQLLLQPIWEGVICQDRNIFFLENAIGSKLIKVYDELISPRNLALYGTKL